MEIFENNNNKKKKTLVTPLINILKLLLLLELHSISMSALESFNFNVILP